MTLTTAKFTLDEYHRMIDAGILVDRNVELLNGELIEMSPEGPPHAGYSTNGAEYLREVLGRQVQIREGKPITLHNNSEPQPDIAIVHRLGNLYFARHPYPEEIFWIIEYSDSSLAKDLEPKRKTYAAAGIREYWVVNLKAKELVVFRSPIDGDYEQELRFKTGTISPLSFPDVSIEVDRLMN
jgi:Uma2 family endonuclease